MQNPLKAIVKEACFSVTGSDPFVLRSTMKYAKAHVAHYICEATVNQVPLEKVILSGDHLGPFVWQHLDAATAMEYSKELVKEYVAAGFRKIHLDPTMPLADDDLATFGNGIIAERAAQLAIISEETYEKTKNDTF